MQPVIQFSDVVKIYPLKAGDVTALNHISFEVERGEFISIMVNHRVPGSQRC